MNGTTNARELAAQLRQRGIYDERVLEAIAYTPRHLFVPAELQSMAYSDQALEIGQGQTISQPYIVALMTEAAAISATARVLEVGTGSGYQGAVLARLCQSLVSIERIPELAERAQECWSRLELPPIVSVIGDGTQGWPEGAPYDAIVVTAGAPTVPPALLGQLAEGGRLVIPIGPEDRQELLIYQRLGNTFSRRKLCDCRFVKLIGSSGWQLVDDVEAR